MQYQRKVRAWNSDESACLELEAQELSGMSAQHLRDRLVAKAPAPGGSAQLRPQVPIDDDPGGGGGGSGSGGGGSAGSPWLAVYRLAWGDFSHRVHLPCYPSGGSILCPVDEFDNQLADGDHIWFDEAEGAPFGITNGQVEIVLTSGGAVTWWKEIKAFDRQGGTLGWVQTQDAAHGPSAMRLDVGRADSIVFGKAKAFGVHTGMYQVLDLYSKRGKRLSFDWRVD